MEPKKCASPFIEKHLPAIMTVIAFSSLLIIWECVARFTKASMFLPPASQILYKFFESFTVPIGKHTMPYHIGISLYRVGVAFSIATVTGILLGVSMGYSKTAEAIIKPIFEFIRPIPPLAWIPMSILWFGLGDQSKFFIIFLGCFCFVTVNTYDGTKNVDPVLLGAARMLGAGLNAGWYSVVGSEMVRSDEGVCWIIVMVLSNGNTVQIMVGMIAIGIVGYVLATLMAKLEGRLCRWNKQQGI